MFPTWLDVILLAFVSLSGLLAAARGFTRELLLLLSWIVSGFVCMSLFPVLQPSVRQILGVNLPADILLAGSIFLFALILLSPVLTRVSGRLIGPRITSIDRIFGFLFGAARGLLIVGAAYLAFTSLVVEGRRPAWIQEAQSLGLLEGTASVLSSGLSRMVSVETVDAVTESGTETVSTEELGERERTSGRQ